MSHIEQGVGRQFGKDAIHFYLIEGHEWNKKNKYQLFKEKIQAFSCAVTFAVFVKGWTITEI